jgi:hypothetical protein
LYDFCFSYEFMGRRSNIVNFFKYSSHLRGFLCLTACLKRIYLLFSYDSPYTYFVQCVEYNNGEQPRLLIPTIQNLVSQILPLYPYVDLRSR